MDRNANRIAWRLALDHYGSQRAIARACGVSQPSVHARIRDDNTIPAEWARAMSDAGGPDVSLLRPDLWPAEQSPA